MTAKIGKTVRKTTLINDERIPSVTIPFENWAGKFVVEIDNCGLSVSKDGYLIIHMIHEIVYLRKAEPGIREPNVRFDITPPKIEE